MEVEGGPECARDAVWAFRDPKKGGAGISNSVKARPGRWPPCATRPSLPADDSESIYALY